MEIPTPPRSMPEDAPDHVEGVNFTDTTPLLEDISYPITTEELSDQHGDHEIQRTNAEPITIQELFDPLGDTTFESPSGVRQMILNMMPEESVGREGYSDRGGSAPKATEESDQSDENESV